MYKENVRINRALGYHIDESETLRKLKVKLEQEIQELKEERQLDGLVIQRKVTESRHNKQLVKEVSLMSCSKHILNWYLSYLQFNYYYYCSNIWQHAIIELFTAQ